MREKSSVDSLFLTRAGFVEFFVVFVKLIHGLSAILPPLVLVFFLDPMAPEMRTHFLGLLVFYLLMTRGSEILLGRVAAKLSKGQATAAGEAMRKAAI